MKFKTLVAIVLLTQVVAFRPDRRESVDYYYNLSKMTDASAPRAMALVKIDTMSSGSSILSRGVLFSYKNRDARAVRIAGTFSQWRSIPMQRNSQGIWYYFLEEYASGTRWNINFRSTASGSRIPCAIRGGMTVPAPTYRSPNRPLPGRAKTLPAG
jgi:hypothetical protein